ncbi:MAG: UDP-N-acetylmuramoyl-L-alanine--D-glutamate ligase [Clostridiales bacterium]|nr:UDP-N-acetylmuramoyl-L-alanine--D-glutamate ligase [Clostridiales bacterium]
MYTMIEKIIEEIKNKKICILGFGIEGKSTYNFIRKHLKNIPIEIRYIKENGEEKSFLEKDNNLKFIINENYLEGLEEYDLIFKSPGISLKDIDTKGIEEKLISQYDLFLKNTDNYTIGITGTKGKSTTSSLIHKVLEEQNKKTYLLGNIGTPIFDLIDTIEKDAIVVLEISSHTLEFAKHSTNIAILLNIFEEHLDHYKNFEGYALAKINLVKNKKDVAIFNLDNENINNLYDNYSNEDFGITINNNKKTNQTISLNDNKIYYNDKFLYDANQDRNLKGKHNLNNIMFVLAVSKILNLDIQKTISTINSFNPLEHRLEYVGKFDGVEYYNDSIATIPEATIESINALEKVNTLIVGGNDRGVDQTELIKFLISSEVENIICLPKTGEYIQEGLKETDKNVKLVNTIEEAVTTAKEVTKKETICVLSPAASSYGYFKNFKERGNKFKELVSN